MFSCYYCNANVKVGKIIKLVDKCVIPCFAAESSPRPGHRDITQTDGEQRIRYQCPGCTAKRCREYL